LETGVIITLFRTPAQTGTAFSKIGCGIQRQSPLFEGLEELPDEKAEAN